MTRLFRRDDVPISKLSFSTQRAYVEQGWGGRPIDHWPVYAFFRQALVGKREAAETAFHLWYLDQYRRYANVDKRDGGMKGGSLQRVVDDVQRTSPEISVVEALDSAVRKRVAQRLALLESMRDEGFRPRNGDAPIEGIRRSQESVELRGGHHRVAALLALECAVVPTMIVWPSPVLARLFK